MVFIDQLVEHCSVKAEDTGSNPVEAPKIFFPATSTCVYKKNQGLNLQTQLN